MRAALISVVFVWSALVSPVARAAPQCLAQDNPCDPDKLCTFKIALADKVAIYQTYLRNSQVTRAQGTRDGIRYRGTLYQAAMTEARSSYPNESRKVQREQANQIFERLVREEVNRAPRTPPCRLGGKPDYKMFPKAGYAGMYTTDACQVFANYEGGPADAASFGASDTTSCQEFYDRDRAHEVIHQRRCKAADAAGTSAKRENINRAIEEEIAAYEHSVKLSAAYVRLLAF
jgi:hypothetical protein